MRNMRLYVIENDWKNSLLWAFRATCVSDRYADAMEVVDVQRADLEKLLKAANERASAELGGEYKLRRSIKQKCHGEADVVFIRDKKKEKVAGIEFYRKIAYNTEFSDEGRFLYDDYLRDEGYESKAVIKLSA